MKNTFSRSITGIGIVLVGVAILLSNLNLLNFDMLLDMYWPVLIMLAGIVVFINDPRSYVWPGIIILVGALLQLQELGIITVNPWTLVWPIIVIAVGVSILINKTANQSNVSKETLDNVSAILGGSDHKSTSDDYRGGRVTAIMGGVKLDIRNAKIKKEAYIDVFSFWGGVELWVPKDVAVQVNASPVLGGIENKAESKLQKNAPTLYISGDVIMAGVEIKN